MSTLLAILRVLGTDCTEEFNEVRQPEHVILNSLPGTSVGSGDQMLPALHRLELHFGRLATDVGCCSAS